MKLVMTLKVRDEAEIIEDNLRFHAAQGVDAFVVADHGSTDGTRELLEPHVRAGLVQLVSVEGRDVLDLAHREMTRLQQLAAEAGADWVIHNDGDEFWWPVTGDLKDALAEVPDDYGMLLAPRAEFVPRPGEGPWPERLCIREARARHRPKIALRPNPSLRIHGLHPESVWVDAPGAQSFPGSPKLRVIEGRDGRTAPAEVVIAPVYPVRVLHFPLRSFAQYQRRIDIALASDETFGERARRVREARGAGRLEQVYEEAAFSDAEVASGLGDGSLVEDRDFAVYLRACPEPGSGQPAPPGAGAWPAARREAELAELRYDAMVAISRRMQAVARDLDARKSERARRRERAGRGQAE